MEHSHPDTTARAEMHTVLASYLDGPAEFETAVCGMGEPELDHLPALGGWTVREIAHHVADGDAIWGAGVKMALGRGQAVFSLQWYWDQPQEVWAERWGYRLRPVAPSLELLRANREHIAQLVRDVPGAWECPLDVRWPDGTVEPLAVRSLIDDQSRHVWQHLAEVRRIQVELGPTTGTADATAAAAPASRRVFDQPGRYEIRIRGELDTRWADGFEGLTVMHRTGNWTQLVGMLPDQAALHALLAKIGNLGLPLISARRLD